MNDVRIITDGGTRESNPGDMYVAYRFIVHSTENGETSKVKTLPVIVDLSVHGTNNQAEYLAVIFGTDALLHYLAERNKNPSDYSIHFVSDSLNLVGQVTGKFNTNAPQLKILKNQLLYLAGLFRTRYFRWVPKKQILKELGC